MCYNDGVASDRNAHFIVKWIVFAIFHLKRRDCVHIKRNPFLDYMGERGSK